MTVGKLEETAAAQSTGTRRTAWSMTAVVILLYMINYADKAVYGIIAQPLARELGLTSSQIGMVGSLFFLMFTIGGFASGLLSRWFGLRWALLALALVWSATVLPVVLSATLAVLIASRMLLGFAEGPSAALMHTAVYSWHAPDKRGFPSALLLSSVSIAKIVFAPLLTYITVSFGWRAALITMAIMGALWCILWVTSWSQGPHLAPAAKSTGEQQSDNTVPWLSIFRTPTFIFGALLFMAYYALQTVILTWLPSYFELGLGFSAQQAGSMFGIPSIFALVYMLTISRVSDRLIARGSTIRRARAVVAASGVALGAVILLFVPYVDSPLVVVAMISLAYGVASGAAPLLNTAVSVICPQRQLAGTLGVYMAIMSVGGLIAPWLAGVIVDHAATKADGFALSFQILGAAAGVFALLALTFINPDRDRLRVLPATTADTEAV
ncbi:MULTISPECIES: MFS transporter [Rhodococcus]|uniref:Putative major facilitator superfamily transporter n=1 Tax=Rhodococcus wratislaviensis NBRC 100605 TaxID=1219028 RepID=X0Q6Y4_RHOWR|nr:MULTISPECIES: MFS transporter [Rhodococcus]WAM19106.1 MFS transporter [Rhodococcus sp. JS3073]GAF47152.1 putative major facilitator superfamily transporter [Rhodococcus wratislaviensis NBRC 100605]